MVRDLHSTIDGRQFTIDRFVASLRNAFLSENTAVARVYLRQLIERITVAPDAITIDANSEAIAHAKATPGGALRNEGFPAVALAVVA